MKTLIAILAAIASLLVVETSQACGAPGTYLTSVDGNTVRVASPISRDPANPKSLLRQDVDTAETVRVSYTCDAGWYVDACVRPGNFRYGFEQPLAAPDSDCACGPYDYFGTAVVESSLPATCASSDEPTVGVPWTNTQVICRPGSSCSSAEPGAPCTPVDAPSGGCTASPGSPNGASPLIALGLVLIVSARRRRSDFRAELTKELHHEHRATLGLRTARGGPQRRRE